MFHSRGLEIYRRPLFIQINARGVYAAMNVNRFFIALQKVNVIGRVKNENILVKPDMIDAGTCYLTSSVQAVVSFYLHNDGRMVVPFTVELPRELSKHIKLGRSKGYVKAGSSLDVFIRICLKCRLFDTLKYYSDVILNFFYLQIRYFAIGGLQRVFQRRQRFPTFPGMDLLVRVQKMSTRSTRNGDCHYSVRFNIESRYFGFWHGWHDGNRCSERCADQSFQSYDVIRIFEITKSNNISIWTYYIQNNKTLTTLLCV